MKRFLLCGVLLALLAGCGTAGEQLPEEVPEETEPLSGEELTASAMAAYTEITKDLTFTLDVEEEDATGISLSITPEAAWNVAGRENLFSIGYQWEPASAEAWGDQWSDIKSRGRLFAMTAPDGETTLQCCTGGDVVLNREQNIVMEAAQFPELQKFVGQELVCTDGTTLLGADDKAGIAIILQAVEELLAEKAPHGKICLGFTPDEEIGMGASFFDVSGFGADFAYTLDGGDITDYEYETFNAAKTVVTINGFSIHPGTSKDKMRNALLIAMEYNALLPALETPAHTEGYEGFFHLQEMHGKAEKATMEYIVRDHDMKRFQERKAMMDKAAEQINRRWGDGTAVVDTHDQYYNMYEVLKDHMEILELAESAMKAAGIEHPTHSPIRGGTDGSVLTYKGLLCPNLPSAGHNAHGRYEYAPVESLKTGVKTVKALVSPELVETIIGKKEG